MTSSRAPRRLLLAVPVLVAAAACGSSSPAANTPPATPAATTAAAPTSAAPSTETEPSTEPSTETTGEPLSDDGDPDADAGAADKDCGTLPTAKAGAALPSGFPGLPKLVITDSETQGATTKVTGYVDGGEEELESTRDSAVALLVAAGYEAGDKDQEEGAEAEGEFEGGAHPGTVTIRNLCKEHLTVIYSFS